MVVQEFIVPEDRKLYKGSDILIIGLDKTTVFIYAIPDFSSYPF